MSDIDLEPYDDDELASAGTTAQAQSALEQKASRQKVKPQPIAVHALPDAFARPDSERRPPLALLRQWIVERLQSDDPTLPADRATIYADLWMEYAEAQDSIDRNGVICLHPRTSVIIENPYVARRDKTRQALAQVRDVRADWLWTADNIERARAWLDAATKERDARLSAAERQRVKQMEGQK